MGAVGGEPRQSHGVSPAGLGGIHRPDVLAVVAGGGVVGAVHGDGVGVVVNGNVHAAADGHLNAGGSAAATGEVVYYEFSHGMSPICSADKQKGRAFCQV